MTNEIEILVKMQLFDDNIAEYLFQIEELPKTLANLQKESDETYQSVKEIEKEIENCMKGQKTEELNIKSNKAKIAKYAYQQNEVKTNKEYKALNSEIDHLKKKNNVCDDIIIEFMESENEFKEKLEDAKKVYEKAKNELNAKEGKINNKISDFENLVKELRDKRNVIAKKLPLSLLKRYAALIKHKNRKAVVFNENNACSGCGFSIRPQVTIELSKGKKYNCENCGRFLVDKKNFSELKK